MQGLMCLAQGHNAVTPVKLEPAAPLSRVKHSTTEPLCSQIDIYSVAGIRYICGLVANFPLPNVQADLSLYFSHTHLKVDFIMPWLIYIYLCITMHCVYPVHCSFQVTIS